MGAIPLIGLPGGYQLDTVVHTMWIRVSTALSNIMPRSRSNDNNVANLPPFVLYLHAIFLPYIIYCRARTNVTE